MADGRLWRIQLDTYVREAERYGGDAGIELCEKPVLRRQRRRDRHLGQRRRRRRAGVAMEAGAGRYRPAHLRCRRRRSLRHVRRCRDAYLAEFDPGGGLKPALGRTWRGQQRGIFELLDLLAAPGDTPYPALAALRRRGEASAALLGELRRRSDAGMLTAPLPDVIQSLCHLHAIRLLRSAARLQELVIYDLLERTYRARQART